jgi:phosphoesterase RecJ-like protein
MDETYRAIARVIKNSRSFLVASHIDPDGDAVGCELAIASVLKRLGKTAKVISDEPIPDTFVFLKGSDDVVAGGNPVPGPADVGLVVDSASLDRLGWPEKVIRACPVVINIDHHESNTYFGDHNLVETGAGACGEVLHRLIRYMEIEPTKDEAEALYVAILSDSGCFRFPTTTGGTLRVAADLLDAGVTAYHAASEIFWKKSAAGLRLLSNALSTIEVSNGGSIAMMEITREMYEETGATPRDTEGFANYPRSIQDVVVGVLIREIEQGRFRVSLRSREGYAISDVARSFGGGGHPTAAGFRISGDRAEVKAKIRDAIGAALLGSGSTSASP